MEISQHIKNLLVSNERVILKDFGAFITKQVSARYDEETETMKPPYKIVTFDPNIKEDAGLLSGYISEQEGYSKEASEELIDEFVKTVKTKLKSGQTVEFKGLGTFNQSPDGKIDFAFLSEENLLLDAFGLPVVSLADKKITTNQTKEPAKTKVQKKAPVKKAKPKIETKKTIKKEKPIKEKTNKKRRKWPIFVILLAAIGLLLSAIYFFKPNLWTKGYNYSSEKIASVKQMFNKDKDQYEIIDPDKEDMNTEVAENNKNKVVEEEYTDEDDIIAEEEDTTFEEGYTDEENLITEENTENNAVEDTEENVTQDVSETTQEVSEPETNTSISSASNGKYYIIVGSVKSEASAKKEQKRFARKGITTSIIYVPNKNRYRISVGEFNSAKEAQDFFSDLQAKHGTIDAWVWEKR
ncbi:MAG: hypothetical protein GXO49_07095 [Chlorobi bacterium]|nr:hypothetical protein [Chlorobiota bacterium]